MENWKLDFWADQKKTFSVMYTFAYLALMVFFYEISKKSCCDALKSSDPPLKGWIFNVIASVEWQYVIVPSLLNSSVYLLLSIQLFDKADTNSYLTGVVVTLVLPICHISWAETKCRYIEIRNEKLGEGNVLSYQAIDTKIAFVWIVNVKKNSYLRI